MELGGDKGIMLILNIISFSVLTAKKQKKEDTVCSIFKFLVLFVVFETYW